MKIGDRSPWGKITSVEEIEHGIWRVDTSSHGGIKLSRAMNNRVPSYMRMDGGWYEEDCEWVIPALVFAVFERNKPGTYEKAAESLKRWNWKMYESFFGVTLKEGESESKDEDLFYKKNDGKYVVISASGSWCGCPVGMVKVIARLGGWRGGADSPQIQLLIPEEEYAKRGSFGYVLSESQVKEALGSQEIVS